METACNYTIGNCCFRLCGEQLLRAMARLQGFDRFVTAGPCTPAFTVRLLPTDSRPEPKRCLYTARAEQVGISFHTVPEGYLLELRHDEGSRLSLWSSTAGRTLSLAGDCTPRLLRFALWVGYGVMNADALRVAIHGSCIVADGGAYLFLGESGTGKSTHTRLWREHIPGAELLNDDSPIVAVEAGRLWIYGSPWSGKTPCYRTERYPLRGCVRLSQAPHNAIERLPLLKAYGAIHPSMPPEFAYDTLYDGISRTIGELLRRVPVFHLACLPNREAALLSYRTLTACRHANDSE